MILSKYLSSLTVPILLSSWANGNLVERQSGATGDRYCGTFMCISGTISEDGSSVEYVLESTGRKDVGWMGIGYGRQMAFTPMVIMWPNSDGSVTLSQRSAPREQQPTVDSNPPRVAAVSTSATTTSGSTPKYAFTIPGIQNNLDPLFLVLIPLQTGSDTKPYVIFAFGDVNPGSSAVDANLQQHIDVGQTRLDLTKSLSSSTTTGSGSSPTGISDSDSNSPSEDIPLLPYQRLIVAHAIFCVVGFLLLLPAGALLARYLRTFTPTWFTGHWVIQLGLAGPAIIIGVALGIQSVTKAGALHLNDTHKKLGAALFALYFVQCAVGAIIHFVKRPGATRRPIQNYFHAVLGLLTIGLAMYQVYLGYKFEWTKTTGREPFPNGVHILYIVWVVAIPVLYFGGLVFLRKQYSQENEARHRLPAKYEEGTDAEHYDMQYRDRD